MTDAPVALAVPDSALVRALRASPNHGARLRLDAPDAVILHYTGMTDGESAVAWLCDPASSVSCHYVVEEDGGILQLVAERRRAWHAGRSVWAGDTDMNSASIGIEIVNAGHPGGLPPYPEPQIEATIALMGDIVRRHRIEAARILAHSDIAPGRKEDPGERFPWRRLAESGLGVWAAPVADDGGAPIGPGAEGPEVAVFQHRLATFGYGIAASGLYDPATAVVVRAFQRHFRPGRIDGVADAETLGTLAALLRTRATAPGPPAWPAAPASP